MQSSINIPRIYVDWGSWLKAIGQFKLGDIVPEHNEWVYNNQMEYNDAYNLIGLNPSNIVTANVNGLEGYGEMTFSSGSFGSEEPSMLPNYCAILGHNFASSGTKLGIGVEQEGENINAGWNTHVPIVNFIDSGSVPQYDGFSISEFSNPFESAKIDYLRLMLGSETEYQDDVKMGAICYGRYYDFPNPPNLNITQSVEMGELARHQSVIGGSLSNSMQTKNMWGDVGAWELYGIEGGTQYKDEASLGARSGRRSWNLTFSYLSDRETLPINALGGSLGDYDSLIDSNNGYTEGEDWYGQGIFGSGAYNYISVLNGSDFFSSCWNKTMGGHLSFIFNPQGGGDNPDNNPSNFAICRFDQDSLQVTQTAPNLYSISLKIREC